MSNLGHEINPFHMRDFLPKMAGISVQSTRYNYMLRPGYMEECFFPVKAELPRSRFRWPWQKR